jgi:hypothetical protein
MPHGSNRSHEHFAHPINNHQSSIVMSGRPGRALGDTLFHPLSSPIPFIEDMDDLNRACDGVSPITPRTPPSELFFEAFTAPSRPTLTEQRLVVDVVSNSDESLLDRSRNDFILVSPREVASRFVLRLSSPHDQHRNESDSMEAPQSALETTMNSRDSAFSDSSIVSPPETRPIATLRHDEERAHNISIDDSECAFAPIQDTDDASLEDQSEHDEFSSPTVGLKSRSNQGAFSSHDLTW